MKRPIFITSIIALAAGLIVIARPAAAQNIDLTWRTVDGGGATFSTGNGFELGGTIGQPDAGAMSGGSFSLQGGFWPGVTSQPQCQDDLNGDRVVNLSDLAILLAHYGLASGASYADGDVNGDGKVDLSDLAALLARYGSTCP